MKLAIVFLLFAAAARAADAADDDDSASGFSIQAQQLAAATAPEDSGMSIMADKKYTCSRTSPCELGCCRPNETGDAGNCGAGPDFCGPKFCHSEC